MFNRQFWGEKGSPDWWCGRVSVADVQRLTCTRRTQSWKEVPQRGPQEWAPEHHGSVFLTTSFPEHGAREPRVCAALCVLGPFTHFLSSPWPSLWAEGQGSTSCQSLKGTC